MEIVELLLKCYENLCLANRSQLLKVVKKMHLGIQSKKLTLLYCFCLENHVTIIVNRYLYFK